MLKFTATFHAPNSDMNFNVDKPSYEEAIVEFIDFCHGNCFYPGSSEIKTLRFGKENLNYNEVFKHLYV